MSVFATVLLADAMNPKRREVKTMKYEKPEITALGDASIVIRGTRDSGPSETGGDFQYPGSDLDD